MPAVASTTDITWPENLYDTYRESKAGTTKFLTWLVDEAATAGHHLASKALFQQAKTPRLKGKERILQKKAAARPTVERYALVTDEILPLARKLAKHKTSVQIPQGILHLIRKVIKARQRCTTWYEKQSTKNDGLRQSNETHAYFTNVLVGTLEVLKSKQNKDAVPSERGNCDEKKPDNHHINIFDYLGSEETELQVDKDNAQGNGAKPPKTPTPGKGSNRKVYEPEVFENVGFAVFCMLEDLERLRLFMRRSWEKYHVKEISIMNVSVCTNTALEFARQIDTDFREKFPKFVDWTAVLQYLHPETDWLGDVKKVYTGQEKQRFRPDLVPDTCPTHSLYFLPFLEVILYNEFGFSVPQIDDIYYPCSDAAGRERNEQWRRDHVLIQHLLRAVPPPQVSHFVVTDEVTECLRHVVSKNPIHLWIIFGLQIQLDIHHILGSNASRGLQELHASAKLIKRMLAAHLHFHNRMEGHVPVPMLWKMDVIVELLDKSILNDIFRYDHFETFGSRSFMLLSMHPLLCGLLQFSFLLATQHLGLVVAQQHGAITAVAHIYNAARQEKGISACWQELEEMIALWTPEKIYVGPPPTDADAYDRRYYLMEGMPAHMFAPDRRDICSPTNKNRRDPFKITPVLDALFWRYCQLEDYKEMTAQKFESLLNTKERNPSLRQNLSRTQDLSPLQLLTLLQSALTKDELILRIDYLGMHKKSMDMLQRIEEGLRKPFICHIEQRTSRIITSHVPNPGLHALPTFLFGFYRMAGSKGPIDPKFNIWLSTAHKIIEDFIEEEEIIRRKDKEIEKENEKAEPVDEERTGESLPILKTASKMGILPPGPHPTINGKCIHFGICTRQMLQGFVNQKPAS